MTKPHSRPATEPAIARPDELTRPEFRDFVASLDADADLDRLAEELTAAHAALVAERERGDELRRRQATLTAKLSTATGTDRTAMLTDLVVIDADSRTLPASIAAATRRHVLARLAYLHRLKVLAEAEARDQVEATNDPITAVDHASLTLFKAEGYAGDAPAPADRVAELRGELREITGALQPARERHAQVKQVAALARAIVELAYGVGIAGFSQLDQSVTSQETVAARAGEAAAERTRREAALPVEVAA